MRRFHFTGLRDNIGSTLLLFNENIILSGKAMCNSPWTMIYQHDAQGKAIRGNKFALVGAVLSGSRIRVAIGRNYYTGAQGVYVRGIQVHAELLNHISKVAWNKMNKNSYWWWGMVSTSGSYYMTSKKTKLFVILSHIYDLNLKQSGIFNHRR